MEKIRTVKKYANDGTPYYTAWLGNVVGGGDTRNEAREELIKNIDCLLDYYQREYHDSVDKCKYLEADRNALIGEYESRITKLQELMSNMEKQLVEKDEEIDKLNSQRTYTIRFGADMVQRVNISDIIYDLITEGICNNIRMLLDCEDNYCYGDNNINIVINRDKFNEIIDSYIKEIKGKEM